MIVAQGKQNDNHCSFVDVGIISVNGGDLQRINAMGMLTSQTEVSLSAKLQWPDVKKCKLNLIYFMQLINFGDMFIKYKHDSVQLDYFDRFKK